MRAKITLFLFGFVPGTFACLSTAFVYAKYAALVYRLDRIESFLSQAFHG